MSLAGTDGRSCSKAVQRHAVVDAPGPEQGLVVRVQQQAEARAERRRRQPRHVDEGRVAARRPVEGRCRVAVVEEALGERRRVRAARHQLGHVIGQVAGHLHVVKERHGRQPPVGQRQRRLQHAAARADLPPGAVLGCFNVRLRQRAVRQVDQRLAPATAVALLGYEDRSEDEAAPGADVGIRQRRLRVRGRPRRRQKRWRAEQAQKRLLARQRHVARRVEEGGADLAGPAVGDLARQQRGGGGGAQVEVHAARHQIDDGARTVEVVQQLHERLAVGRHVRRFGAKVRLGVQRQPHDAHAYQRREVFLAQRGQHWAPAVCRDSGGGAVAEGVEARDLDAAKDVFVAPAHLGGREQVRLQVAHVGLAQP